MMSDQKVIRILIVDDHNVVRKGLRAFLLSFDDLELIGEAGSGEQAIQHCLQDAPDVVLMDLVMPGMDGATAARMIRRHNPSIQVIALTSFPEEELVEQALEAGAISYLLKNVEAHELAEAIRNAAQGRPTLAPEATQALIHVHLRAPAIGHDLTTREHEVLLAMANGLSNREIADQLGVSYATIKFHVANVLSKLGSRRRAEAVSIAHQHHLLD